MQDNHSQIIIYQTQDGKVKIETQFENETVWLSIEQISELFQKSRSTINEHILNIYKEQELEKEMTLRKIGNSDFSTKPTNFYNLDLISKEILNNSGKISHQKALEKAHSEYSIYKEKVNNQISEVEKDFLKQLEINTKNLKK